MREPEDTELDPEMIAPIDRSRPATSPPKTSPIAAQTAKQSDPDADSRAERQMMYDEYQTGSASESRHSSAVRQARQLCVQLASGSRRCCPSPSGLNERLRPRDEGPGRHHRRLESTKDRRSSSPVACPELLKSLFELEVRRSPTAASRSARRPRARLPFEIASSPTPTGVDPVGPASAPEARGCGWSSPGCAREDRIIPTTTTRSLRRQKPLTAQRGEGDSRREERQRR